MNYIGTSDLLHDLSAWIDRGNTHRDPEAVRWGRLSKVAEECGEVISAFIAATGQNPRKGVCGTIGDVEQELLDVAVTALCAVAHLRGNDHGDVIAMLSAKVTAVADRAGIAVEIA